MSDWLTNINMITFFLFSLLSTRRKNEDKDDTQKEENIQIIWRRKEKNKDEKERLKDRKNGEEIRNEGNNNRTNIRKISRE